jgi:HJR/Mrr/RecB family endonuclease
VQEIVGAIKFYNSDEGWVITSSSFTASARSLAQANNIKLIDGHDLKDFAALSRAIRTAFPKRGLSA